MSNELTGPRIPGSRYIEWWHALEAQDWEAIAPGNSSTTKQLINALFHVGMRNGAARRELRPEGKSIGIYLLSNDDFDWTQDIVFARTSHYLLPPERLIEEVETATGIKADAPLEEDVEPMVERLRDAREARDE